MDNQIVEFVVCNVCDRKFKAKSRLVLHLYNYHQALYTKSSAKAYIKEAYGNIVTKSEYNTMIKRAQTNLNRYGVENTFQSEEKKAKLRQTNLERYGSESPVQTEEIKAKTKATCLKKYGVENVSQAQEIKDTKRAVCLEKFGVENPFQSEEKKQKIRETNLSKYGFEYAAQSPIVQERIKLACIEKYGVENPFQSEEIKSKIKATCIERYGLDWWHNNVYANQSGGCRIGKNEALILDSIELEQGITLVRQYPIGRYSIDGYDESNNVAYEVHEKYHTTVEQEHADLIRSAFIKEALGCDIIIIKDF